MYSLIIFAVFISFTEGLDRLDLQRKWGFLVVFHRRITLKSQEICIGSALSKSLIITSSNCFKDTSIKEFLIVSNRFYSHNLKREVNHSILNLYKNKEITVVKVKPSLAHFVEIPEHHFTLNVGRVCTTFGWKEKNRLMKLIEVLTNITNAKPSKIVAKNQNETIMMDGFYTGTPLICQIDENNQLVGVGSFLELHGQNTFANVFKNLTWIRSLLMDPDINFDPLRVRNSSPKRIEIHEIIFFSNLMLYKCIL